MQNEYLVAKREISQRIASKGFRVATGLTMIAALLYVMVPHILASNSHPNIIGVVKTQSVINNSIKQISAIAGVNVVFRNYSTDTKLDSEVKNGSVFIGVLDNGSLAVRSSTESNQAFIIASQVAQVLGTLNAYNRAGLSKSQREIISHPQDPNVLALTHTSSRSSTQSKSQYFELILMYVLLSQYGAWVMLGVIEEKSTRVIEVLLSVLKPVELLAGKIMGIGVVALLHATLLIASLIAGLNIIGSSPSSLISGSLLITGPTFFVIGFALYCAVFAAVGSTVSRTEDAQAVSFPVALPMLVGYILGFVSIAQTSPSEWIKLAALIPGISPFLAPVLLAQQSISVSYFLLSVAMSIVSTFFIIQLSAKIYQASILKIGSRVKLRSAFAK